MLLDSLAAGLLGNMLEGKGVIRGSDGVIWATEEVVSTGEERLLMSL